MRRAKLAALAVAAADPVATNPAETEARKRFGIKG